MNAPDELLDAIYLGDDPDSAALMLADWYEERDQPHWAWLIRLSVFRRQTAMMDPRWEYWDELRSLWIERHRADWFAGYPWQQWEPEPAARGDWFDDWGQPVAFQHLAGRQPGQSPGEWNAACWRDLPLRRTRFYGGTADTQAAVEPILSQLRGISLAQFAEENDRIFDWLGNSKQPIQLESLAVELPNSRALQHPAFRHSEAVERLRSLAVRLPAAAEMSGIRWGETIWAKRLRSLMLRAEDGGESWPRLVVHPITDRAVFPELENLRLERFSLDWPVEARGPMQGWNPTRKLRNLVLAEVTTGRNWAVLGAHWRWCGVESLRLEFAQWHAGLQAFLAPFPAGGTLRHLEFRLGDLSAENWERFCDWPGFATLNRCLIHASTLPQVGFEPFVSAVSQSDIRHLELIQMRDESGGDWETMALEHLAESLRPGQLLGLRLRLGGEFNLSESAFEAMVRLLSAPSTAKLRSFEWQVSLDGERLSRLVDALRLPHLRRLKFRFSRPYQCNLHALLTSPQLPRLACVMVDSDVRVMAPESWQSVSLGGRGQVFTELSRIQPDEPFQESIWR
ncbi:hypothetical protein [Tuwongella immobilis]|uniref:Uncharacterized protein n=1 Tax=Tuwongella immobilis TaxID=692036 RepID=A0A6C2YUY3_9BACT|nr:hypothetical protein [Tuwongella immobilis]VIP04973.1 unnamed protein product [Tuwongella immobilis]VTS07304.1 unnamed protein product [Tuwongella immobilis]